LVPASQFVRDRASHVAAPCVAEANGGMQAHVHPDVQAHVQAIEALREQLTIAKRRIDELLADRRRDADERRRLLDALTARRSWWRQWFR
jgi:hypothetical protein